MAARLNKYLLLLLLLTGCSSSLDINPNFGDVAYIIKESEVFDCTIDGIETDCVFGIGQLTCNPIDLFTYEVDTGAAVLNTDSTQVACSTTTRPRFDGIETNNPLFEL